MFKKLFRSPDFIIIGVQKGATGSLFNYLNIHPQLSGSEKKEIHFFDRDDHYFNGNNWYLNHFKTKKPFGNKILNFEATPRYIYAENVPGRIKKFNKNLRFVILLRNPVDRAYSAWNMYRQFADNPRMVQLIMESAQINGYVHMFDFLYGSKFPSFEETIEFETGNARFKGKYPEPGIVKRGFYLEQIKKWYSYFPEEKFHFLFTEDLKTNLIRELDRIAEFLNVNYHDWTKHDLNLHHVRGYETIISNKTKEKLDLLYKEANDGLDNLIHKTVIWQ